LAEIYFDGVMSAGRYAHKKKSRKQGDGRAGARTAIMGIGAAGMVWGGATLLMHPARSPANVTTAPHSLPAPHIALIPTPVAAPRSVVAAKTTPHGDRLAAALAGAGYDTRGREDRYAPGTTASLDARRVAWFPVSDGRFNTDGAGRFMLDPVATGAAMLATDNSQPSMNAADADAFHPVAVARADVPEPSDEMLAALSSDPAAKAPATATEVRSQVADIAIPTSPALPSRDEPLPIPSAPPPQIARAVTQEEYRLASLGTASSPAAAGTPDASGASDTTLVAPAPAEVRSLPEIVPLPDLRPNRDAADAPSRAAPPAKSAGVALAYARPEPPAQRSGGGLLSRLFGNGSRTKLPNPGNGIAVYDIKAATVYLPDGERLEAHSGLGPMRDQPRYVTAKNRGPTPPNVYDLVMREQRFHGVEAVRLLPADGENKYGRVGLLAHTYMYRGGGGFAQSNGCVVFKDYHKFLAAFKAGKIKRMIVVPSIDQLPSYMASL
jgi:hypothetical protein